MKKIIIGITICIIGGFIVAQYPKTPHIKPPIPADIDQALLTWAIINAATKEQKECNLYIDRYQISTQAAQGSPFIYETIIDTYTGEIVSRKKIHKELYTKN
tara:strand:+ start:400 stop:705 length:306 start_codon:yes stop_codon:yes gene_type:complete